MKHKLLHCAFIILATIDYIVNILSSSIKSHSRTFFGNVFQCFLHALQKYAHNR